MFQIKDVIYDPSICGIEPQLIIRKVKEIFRESRLKQTCINFMNRDTKHKHSPFPLHWFNFFYKKCSAALFW
jgi:hypothetical protein